MRADGQRQAPGATRGLSVVRWVRRLGIHATFGVCAAWLAAAPAGAARVSAVAPQGEVARVQQVRVQFDRDLVPAGNPSQPAPYALRCDGRSPAGDGRWTSGREWVYALHRPLPAGVNCSLEPDPAFKPPDGAWEGQTRFQFSTGAPVVLSVQPYPDTRIEEDQHFLVTLNGAVDAGSVRRSVWCEVDGLAERMPVRLLEGPERERVLRALHRRNSTRHTVVLSCQRPLPADIGVRLVWGPGVAAAGQPGRVSRQAQRYAWTVRPRLLAEFSCERENAAAACLPLRPLQLRFNAPVPRAQALAVRLTPLNADGSPAGTPLPTLAEGDEDNPLVWALRFAAPLPPQTRFRLSLPEGLQDEIGRPLANAGAFPLTVATGPLPALARFAAAPFGILESSRDPAQPPLLPLTVRHVQADLQGASTSGQVRIKRLDASRSDAELLQWIGRLQADHRTQFESRERSLLETEAAVQRLTLPPPRGPSVPNPDPAPPTEVLGLPLPQPGYHVVEVESRILGQSLLARQAPLYVRTGVLVSNLAVHFKRGRSSSLVWVTTLDRGRAVAGARVAVNDCRGTPLWSGLTDAQGVAAIPQGFDEGEGPDDCLTADGFFVTARSGDELGLVFSRWDRGIESWRFNLPTAGGTQPDARAHTVLDRSLVRVGDTVGMKHFLRLETDRGLALPPADALPEALLITHLGSGTEYRLPLQWAAGGRAAESRWTVPQHAALGQYHLALTRGTQQWSSGSLRVEAFRVPLVDARLALPAANGGVAPQAVVFQAQLNAMAGGPMPDQPLSLTAVLRPAVPRFAGYEDVRFDPPRSAQDAGAADADEDADEDTPSGNARLVANRLAARTDAQGAASLRVSDWPPLTAPAELQAELSFTDPVGEVQTVAQSLRLWPAALVAGVRVPDWLAARGPVQATAVVLDTQGRPLAGREVAVLGRSHRSYSVRQRVVGGFYAYDNRHETRDLGTLCSGRTDARGELRCRIDPGVAGQVELIARARDDAGRTSEGSASVWRSGSEGEGWFAQGDDDRIELLPQQRSVEPGQTARLQLRMPFRQATALLTVEREGILHTRVLQLSGREPLIELPIPPALAGQPSWAPNVVVSVLVLRGRLREAPWWSLFTWGWRQPAQWWQAFRHEGADWRAPTAMVDLAKPAFRIGVTSLDVGLAAHRLDVQVQPERTSYGTRETVRTRVRVTQGGQPVPKAQIAFAAVDEGLLALQDNRSWDLLGGLLQPRPWGVETATAAGEVIGRRHHGRKALPPGGGGGRNPTRELFDTVLLWRGTLTLDEQGEAVVDVPLNDSLTRFRLVAVADAGRDRFGHGSAHVRVSQDLQMLPGLPLLVREGDQFEAGFTLRNATAAQMRVQARLEARAVASADGPSGAASAPGPGLPGLEPQQVELAPGAATELRWPVRVPAGARSLQWEAAAEQVGGPARDRVRVLQPVQPAVPQRVWQAWLHAWPADPADATAMAPALVAPPAGALPGRTETEAVLRPRLGGTLPGLQRYFQTYPYTCLEQRSSRALVLRDEAAWRALADELPAYLDIDGLAHYFPPPPGAGALGSDRLTAYLLSAAHAAGRAWPAAQQEAMLTGLSDFVEGRLERRRTAPRADLDVRKLAALEALSRHGRAEVRMLDAIAFVPTAWPTSALLDAWAVLQRLPEHATRATRLQAVEGLIRSRLSWSGRTLRFSTEETDQWSWLMETPDANAARLLLAAVEHPGWQADLPRLLLGTLARQRQGAWLTTTANLWGALALERYAAVHEREAVSGRTRLQLGEQAATLDWAATPEGGSLHWRGPAGAEALQMQHQGSGRPWLELQLRAAVPLTAPVAAGYRISRIVEPVQRQRPDAWSRGDILRVQLLIDAAQDEGWVVIHDPIPAGAVLLGSGLGRDARLVGADPGRTPIPAGATPAPLRYEERGADAWRGYAEALPRGRWSVSYTLRLNTAGRFALPPTRVEALYAPETFGETPNVLLEVLP